MISVAAHSGPQQFRREWPASLGAMIALSEMTGADFGAETAEARKEPIFRTITEAQLRILRGAAALDSAGLRAAVSRFLRDIHDIDRRFTGTYDQDCQYDSKIAIYSLVYLAPNIRVIELLLQAYVPMLRPGVFDPALQYKIARTFREDVWHLLYDVFDVEPAGDHKHFDWPGSLNHVEDAARRELLHFAGLPTFAHRYLPDESVWLAHTNLQPGRSYLGDMISRYAEEGLSFDHEELLAAGDPDEHRSF